MHRFVCVFRVLLSPVHTHLSCEKNSFEIELDHTGLGLKSTQKGQGAAYLLCRAFERWMVCVLPLYLGSFALSFIIDF